MLRVRDAQIRGNVGRVLTVVEAESTKQLVSDDTALFASQDDHVASKTTAVSSSRAHAVMDETTSAELGNPSMTYEEAARIIQGASRKRQASGCVSALRQQRSLQLSQANAEEKAATARRARLRAQAKAASDAAEVAARDVAMLQAEAHAAAQKRGDNLVVRVQEDVELVDRIDLQLLEENSRLIRWRGELQAGIRALLTATAAAQRAQIMQSSPGAIWRLPVSCTVVTE